jgi:enolase
MIIPVGAPSFSEGLRYSVEVFHSLKKLLAASNHTTAVGDEGGFAPNLSSHEEAFALLMQAIEGAGYEPGKEVCLAIDFASSELYREGSYYVGGEKMNASDLASMISNWTSRYPLISVEDGMAEEDEAGWQELTRRLGHKIQLIGDDNFVTQARYLEQGIQNKIANGILIKPNQVGTLTETLATIALAKRANYACVISHRSGETSDPTIADLAVATASGQIKTGSVCRSERVEKYNRLLKIELELGKNARYWGRSVFMKESV